jgi:hypothetical protein
MDPIRARVVETIDERSSHRHRQYNRDTVIAT